MDIFGFYPQSVQGADILSTSDKDQKYQVIMPDFFEGSPADISWYPPDNDEKGAKLGAFFKNQGAPPKAAARVPGIVAAAQKLNPSINTWAVVGFCWGGKIVSILTSKDDTIFKVAAECHPAMVDPKEAEGIKIPLAMLASGDEPEEDVKKFEANLKGEKHVETFKDQVHGVRGFLLIYLHECPWHPCLETDSRSLGKTVADDCILTVVDGCSSRSQ